MTLKTRSAAVGAALAATLCAVPLALATPSGATFTTNPTGQAVNQNHYSSPDDVYLNGGPPCNAPARATSMPDGTYYFRVTTPNGKTTLSTSPQASRSFVVSGGRIVSSTAPTNPRACGGGLVVKVGPFAQSPNGVYKLWISRGSASFSPSGSKTDNFMVDPSPTTPPPPPPLGGGGGGSF